MRSYRTKKLSRQMSLFISDTSLFDYNKWHHSAVVLNGNDKAENVMRIYLNGKRLNGKPRIAVRQGPKSLKFYNTTPIAVQLGALPSGNYFSQFLIDEFRISSNARYNSNFSIQVESLTHDSTTSALFHFDGNLNGLGTNKSKIQATAGLG